MAAGRLLEILVLLMAAAVAAAFGVQDVPAEYCWWYHNGDKAAPFELGTAAAIHLGNTNSCIAGYDGTGGNYYQLCIPSWVAVTENGTLAGEAAMNHAAVSPGTAISGFMRFMNIRLEHPVIKRAMELVPYKFVEWLGWAAIQIQVEHQQAKVFSATHLAGVLMAELKHKAEAHLGRDMSHAVIAVPSHLTYNGRQDVVSAASTWGGFRGGVKAIDQQIAAAAAYDHHTETEEKTILVLRVGGRTSDATIFKLVHGAARYVFAQHDFFLGGDDLTARIVDYMAELIKQRHQWDIRQDGKALHSLRVACEHAKKALSHQEETLVQVDGIGFSAPLTRAKFEELNQDLLDRAMALVEVTMSRARGGQGPKDMVDEIVLVGGSARIPKLRQLVQDYFGREPNRDSRRKGGGGGGGWGVEAAEAIVRGTAILSRPESARYVDECFGK